MGCLTDEQLVALVEGQLSSDEWNHLRRHIAHCDACHEIVVDVVRGVPPPEPPEPPAPPEPPEPEPSPVWEPPSEFDEFRLERILGRGAMGVVYLARDSSLGRDVAIKFIASQQPSPQVRAQFEKEARIIARLKHPNVVTVYRVGTVDGHPYIVSEFVEGKNLAALPLPLPWRRVLTLGLKLSRGLAVAHHEGVLHRDLKPSNAILTAAGEVKLLDFGLAELAELRGGEHSSRAKTVAGTPLYMAPEVLGGKSATPQSDLYSLGLTLYELLTGSLPLWAIKRALPAPVAAAAGGPDRESLQLELGPEIDPDFAALIARCLSFDPAERFASTDILCEALERLEKIYSSIPLAAGNPYRGLSPFEAEHRALFFGRDADINTVLERLRSQPLVLVAGDSGVGKSSLCRAGVLPRVTTEALEEGRHVTTVTMWPGRRPLLALAAALAPVLGRREPELVTELTTNLSWLGQALRAEFQGRRGLLLFIDQLEELVTLSEPEQAERFATLLGELALPATGVKVLLAVRGDFLTRVSALPGLGDEAERALFILRPMSPMGVREAIIGPARSRGVVFESDALIQTLVASTAHGTGSLPLLQFALAELWERHNPEQRRITQAALDEMGGVAGALSRHADGVLARLSPSEQQAARQLLLLLVTAEGTRSERSEEELLMIPSAERRAALQALVEGRLLDARTAGGQARYVIAHDSLIQSWGTLRNWLDDDIGHRAVRQRVEAASAEWERLAQAKEALWGQRQLDETHPLDPSTLGPREHAFLLASRRTVRRQRWGRYLAVLFMVSALAAVYGSLRFQAYLADARFVDAELGTARSAFAEGQALAEQARAQRREALALFDGRVSPTSASGVVSGIPNLREVAERQWTKALDLQKEADETYSRAGQFLEKALDRAGDNQEARRLLAEVTYARVLLAERFHQQRERDELLHNLERMIASLDDGAEWKRRISEPAELALETDPPGAHVLLERYHPDSQGVLRPQPIRELGLTPITHENLPEGSYLLRITQQDRAPIDLPLLLRRGQHEQSHLVLPRSVPTGYAYIPPGCFLLGTSEPENVRRFMRSSPLHRFCLTEGYLIGKTEVTFGDWVAYLNSLPPDAAVRHVLDQPRFSGPGAVTLRYQPGSGWIFSLYRSHDAVFTARERELLRYPGRTRRATADWRQFPLTGVSAEDLNGYFYWLDSTGRLPGARLCSELEWEHAARGADSREYPHGDRLLPDDANIDATYGRQLMAFGPDMVGSHPVATSPFGLADMTGNAFELTRPATSDVGRIALRGGAWYYDELAALVANRSAGDPTQREVTIGVRICASFPNR